MSLQDQDQPSPILAVCLLGFLPALIIGILGAVDWGLKPLPQKPAIHEAANELRLNSVLIGFVDILALLHVVGAVVAFHHVRRHAIFALGVLVIQLSLTGYLWYGARTAFAVGGYTWHPMNG